MEMGSQAAPSGPPEETVQEFVRGLFPRKRDRACEPQAEAVDVGDDLALEAAPLIVAQKLRQWVIVSPHEVVPSKQMRDELVSDDLDPHESSDGGRKSRGTLPETDLIWHGRIVNHESNLGEKRHEGEKVL